MDKVKFESIIGSGFKELIYENREYLEVSNDLSVIIDESVDMVIGLIDNNNNNNNILSDEDVRKLMDEYNEPDLSGHTGWNELERDWDSEKKKEYSGQTFKDYNYRTHRGVSNREYLTKQVHQFIIPDMLDMLKRTIGKEVTHG